MSKQHRPSTSSRESSNAALFKQLFESDQNRLYSYIYAFVSNHSMADDIFQETSVTLWQNFEKFEPGTNFSKWANVIAFNRIRHHRQANKKYQLGLSDDFTQEFSQNIAVMESQAIKQEQRWLHLEHCHSLLSEPLKQVYQSFYIDNFTANDIAEQSGRSVRAIRKAVHKLRTKLFECVDKKVQKAS
jgi:RNA polymerase sigma-70 factor (ECF subfamily)